MKIRINKLVSILSVFFVVSGPASADADRVLDLAVKGNNEFAVGLLKSVAKNQITKEGNKFVSPISAYLALSMALNGATGKNAEQISGVLGLARSSREEFNASNRELLNSLKFNHITPENEGYTVQIANSLWGNRAEAKDINLGFQKGLSNFYDATSLFRGFAGEEASATLKEINASVRKDTQGKIKEMLSRVSDDMLLILLNATYVKGSWMYPFEKGGTKREPFAVTKDRSVDVDTMHVSKSFKHIENDELEAIELPVGKENTSRKFEKAPLSVFVVMPKSLEQFEKSLSSQSLSKLLADIDDTETVTGSVALPKLKLGFTIPLNSNLQKFDPARGLGMPLAFDASARGFGDISSGSLAISLVLQKTYLGIDELGIEAAGATAVILGRGLAREDFEMKVNRPYLLVLRDNKSGAILFLGSIQQPVIE